MGLPVLRLIPFVYMPSPLPRQVRWDSSLVIPIDIGLPRVRAGRLLHYSFRGLLSVHLCYGLQTRQVALRDPLYQRLQQLRYLHYCSDCYRVERTSSRAGFLIPAMDQHLFTAHLTPKLAARAAPRKSIRRKHPLPKLFLPRRLPGRLTPSIPSSR
jgi:hypothetical protein